MGGIARKSLRPGTAICLSDLDADLLVLQGDSAESLRILNSRIGRIEFQGNGLELGSLSLEGCSIESDLELSRTSKLMCRDLLIKDTKIAGKLGIVGAVIEGTCALHDLELGRGLELSRSKVGEFIGKSIMVGSGGVSFQRSEVANSLSLTDSTINGITAFDGSQVGGPADLSMTTFRGWFSAIRSHWGDRLRISWSEGRGDKQFASGLDLTEAVVGGELVMESAGCGADLILIGCHIAGGLNLHNAKVQGHLEVRRSVFSDCFNAGGIHVLSTSHIHESTFKAGINLNRSAWDAALSVKDVQVAEGFTCEGTSFSQDFILDSLEVMLDCNMNGASSSGSLLMRDSRFEKQFSMDGFAMEEVSSAMEITRCDFLSRASMCHMKLASRRVSMVDCVFGRQFYFRGNCIDVPVVRISGVDFQGLASFQGTEFVRSNSVYVNAIIGDSIEISRDQLEGKLHIVKHRKGGRDRYSSHIRNAKSYEWAMEVFQRNKKHSDEDWALYKALVEKHRAKFYLGIGKSRQTGNTSHRGDEVRKHSRILSILRAVFVEYLGILFFWRFACGFGLKLWRLFIASGIVIMIFAVIYSNTTRDIIHSEELLRDAQRHNIIEIESVNSTIDELSENYSMVFRHSLMYSATSFTSYGAGASVARVGSAVGYLVMLEGFLGLFFTTIFVGSAIRKVMRTG